MVQVYALKIGEKTADRSLYMYRDPSHEKFTFAFYFWAIVTDDEPIIVDTAFDALDAERRKVERYADRTALLAHIGIRPADVKTVVMTHLHWDHWAGHALFPNATFWVQRKEVAFWGGPVWRSPPVAASASASAIGALVGLNTAMRLRQYHGARNFGAGVRTVPIGGHTPGLQVVTVEAERGRVVLANDAAHFYRNLDERHPVQIVIDMEATIRGFDTVEELADSRKLIVAGHDMAVVQRFETVAPGVIRLG